MRLDLLVGLDSTDEVDLVVPVVLEVQNLGPSILVGLDIQDRVSSAAAADCCSCCYSRGGALQSL